MEKYVKSILLVTAILLSNILYLFADTTDSSTLIEEAKNYDNSQVVYQGEIIGDIMKRGEYTWINVHDGANAIGVWLPTSEAEKITYSGAYKYKGDIVRIAGEFHRVCTKHGGDLDIHASELEIVETGERRNIPIDIGKAICAAVLSGVALGMFLYTKHKNIW